MIGIGGIGLSAIARVLDARGIHVTGCDAQASMLTEELTKAGIAVAVGHDVGHLCGVDLVVISSAIPETNAEVLGALEAGIPVVHRRELLAYMMRDSDGIAVAGTHGKTTTTAMIAYILAKLGQDPTYIVGGLSPDLGGNAGAGKGRWFVLEADEYDHAFEDLRPYVGLVTSIEMDHPDCFADIGALREAFGTFMAHVRPDGWLVVSADSPEVGRAIEEAGPSARLVTFGSAEHATCRLSGVQPTREGGVRYDWIHAEHGSVAVTLRVPGLLNAENATAAMAAVACCGIDPVAAADALRRFRGVARRFEVKGERDGVVVVDDYAHHPSAIRATLAAARARYPDRRVVAVFQPHTYSRTEALLDEFAACFGDADLVRLVDVFPARLSERRTVTSADLAAAMRHDDVAYAGDIDSTVARLRTEITPGDLLITLGAGNGYLIGERLLSERERRA